MASTIEVQLLDRFLSDSTSAGGSGGGISTVNIVVGVILAFGLLVFLPLLWRKLGYLHPLDGLFNADLSSIAEARRRRQDEFNEAQAQRRQENRQRQIDESLVVKKFGDIEADQSSTTDTNLTELTADDIVPKISSLKPQKSCASMENSGDEEMNNEIDTTDVATPCHICLEVFLREDDVAYSARSGCKHLFHRKCILEWLQCHSECPVCRAKFLATDDRIKVQDQD